MDCGGGVADGPSLKRFGGGGGSSLSSDMILDVLRGSAGLPGGGFVGPELGRPYGSGPGGCRCIADRGRAAGPKGGGDRPTGE